MASSVDKLLTPKLMYSENTAAPHISSRTLRVSPRGSWASFEGAGDDHPGLVTIAIYEHPVRKMRTTAAIAAKPGATRIVGFGRPRACIGKRKRRDGYKGVKLGSFERMYCTHHFDSGYREVVGASPAMVAWDRGWTLPTALRLPGAMSCPARSLVWMAGLVTW